MAGKLRGDHYSLPAETLTYTVVVSQNPAKSSDRREQAKEWIKLLSSYLQCEAGKAQKEMWIKEAKDISKEGSRKIRTMIYICYYKHSLPY